MNYDRFSDLCKLKGITPTALTLSLGLSKGNATSWKKNGNPSVDVLIKLADYLDCSTDYLLDRTNQPDMISFDDKGNPFIIKPHLTNK